MCVNPLESPFGVSKTTFAFSRFPGVFGVLIFEMSFWDSLQAENKQLLPSTPFALEIEPFFLPVPLFERRPLLIVLFFYNLRKYGLTRALPPLNFYKCRKQASILCG